LSFLEWPQVGKTLVTPGNNTSSGGNNTVHKSGSTKKSLSTPSADQQAGWIRTMTNAYQSLVRSNAPLPKELRDLALKNKGAGGYAVALERFVRTKDKSHYKNSINYAKRVQELMRSLRGIFGPDYKPKADVPGLIAAFGFADPDKTDAIGYFGKVLAKSKEFDKFFPGFTEWYTAASRDTTFASSTLAVEAFKDRRFAYEQAYRKAMSSSTVDAAFILAALKGNWDDTQFSLNMTSSDAWKKGPGASRDEEFKRNWDSIFQGSKYEGKYNTLLMAKYQTGSMDFQTLEDSDIKDLPEFGEVFPLYADWEKKQHGLGTPEGKINVFTYLSAQSDARIGFTDLYRRLMGNVDAVIPPDLLKKATDGNWSDALFEIYFKKNDPAYQGTDSYKHDVESFDLYWRKMFGENSTPDPTLASAYAAGSYTDPLQMFDQIKNTGEFQSQFGNWDAFSAAQHAAGGTAMSDPLKYNEYKTAFNNAFSAVGLSAPQDLERQFFASGETTEDFTNHVELFANTQEANKWQNGQQADLATATDLGDKMQGGLLRKKLQEALVAQKAYTQSSFTPFRTENTQAGALKQNI